MPMVLISAETSGPDGAFRAIETALKERFKSPCRVLSATWIVEADQSPHEIYLQILQPILDPHQDKCIVVPLDGEWTAHNTLTRAKCRNLG